VDESLYAVAFLKPIESDPLIDDELVDDVALARGKVLRQRPPQPLDGVLARLDFHLLQLGDHRRQEAS